MMLSSRWPVKGSGTKGGRLFALDCPSCGAPLRRSHADGALRYVCPAAFFTARYADTGRPPVCAGPVSYSAVELVAAVRSRGRLEASMTS